MALSVVGRVAYAGKYNYYTCKMSSVDTLLPSASEWWNINHQESNSNEQGPGRSLGREPIFGILDNSFWLKKLIGTPKGGGPWPTAPPPGYATALSHCHVSGLVALCQ